MVECALFIALVGILGAVAKYGSSAPHKPQHRKYRKWIGRGFGG